MSLESDLKKASTNIKRDADRKYRATCLGLLGKIVRRTPVGNPDIWKNPPPPGYIGGTLRNAWRASLGSPSNEVGDRPDEGASDANQSGRQAVLSLNIGEDFWMANNMPYAQRVEEGWSSQAPAGMVRITLAESGFDAERIMGG